jgi:hypothetical protein
VRRSEKVLGTAVLLGLAVALGLAAQQMSTPAGEEPPIDVRLATMADRLELARTFATLAVFSPTVPDQHLHAQRVVNLLEGTGGEHFAERFSPEGKVVGLLPEARAIAFFLSRVAPDQGGRGEAALAAKEIVRFLDLALEEALAGLRSRRPEGVALSLRRAFAFLSAALGRAEDAPALGGVRALRALVASLPPKL